ncbi:glycosyltransferase family 4 protein [uncultured Polaribacter sp.]|uniref:glycosyltransferase family 4 protein n=1 Tax=uncultured Polaribacter sp. TaxID=174711 RepID=UPI00260BCAB4|nr:glycosyltransferase family 4 protein [uncultured Polaribacter sp.]
MFRKKNILLISPFFYPEPISTGKFNTELVIALAELGHKVTVLCFHPFYPDWKTEKSNAFLKNVSIIRGGNHIKYTKKQFLRRIILEVSFAFFILRKIKKHQKGKDIVLPVFPPSFAFYAILFFLNKKIKKVGMVHDLQEIYSVNKKGIFNKLIRFLIHKIEKKCYHKCDTLIFLSNEMKDEAKRLYDLQEEKLKVQYPFINLTDKVSNTLGHVFDEEKINIVYSGALGEKQNPIELYRFFNYAATKIENVQFYFFSQGVFYEELKRNNANKLIKFYNLVEKDQIEELYQRSDIQLIPQAQNTSKGSLPSKLPNLLISGCKVLVITDKNSELEHLFKENNLNLVVTSWSEDKLLNSLKILIASNNNTTHQQKVAKKLFTIEDMIGKVLS